MSDPRSTEFDQTRCPGSLRTPKGTTTLLHGGGTVGACRSCGRVHHLRQDGTVKSHKVTTPSAGGEPRG